jgi:hypothetical protein
VEEPRSPRGHNHTTYVSYLLRMWCVSVEGEAEKWLASVESPLTREQHNFANLEDLLAFLRVMTGQLTPGNPGNTKS